MCKNDKSKRFEPIARKYRNYILQFGKNTPSYLLRCNGLPCTLPCKTKVAVLVSYSWVYLIEISSPTLKYFVRNKAHPEVLISEAYLMKESETFCSRYLSGIET